MRVVGFTFVKNGIKYDYPFRESIRSLLPLCDEVIVVAGDSDDATTEEIRLIQSPKIKIIETIWDPTLRDGGRVLAQQTNIALSYVRGDWGIYLQADEVLHQDDYATIQNAMELYLHKHEVEGLLFSYYHFFGSYQYIGNSRRWYRREIRIVRPVPGLTSWGDAQGFRINTRKLYVKLIDARIYHYGWVKPPRVQMEKQRSFHSLWHPVRWVEQHLGSQQEFDYTINAGKLIPFTGTHPSVMLERINSQSWKFEYDESKTKIPLKDAILDWIESLTGYRIGEYKNYTLI
ncbi:MAG: glycosyltransferase family 2 protein [Bacteroidetes bacterium]|nr:glycosyltransferase family 2 protein [Bacteroidota bacterium]